MDSQQQESPEPVSTEEQPETTTQPAPSDAGKSNKKNLILVALAILLLAGGVMAFLFIKDKDSSTSTNTNTNSDQSQQTESAANNQKDSDETVAAAIDCEDGYQAFADEEFGAAFCYPSEWGTATVQDAKIAAEDTGHRQIITFSANPQFVVGGASENWSTAVGRGGSCLEPSNKPAEPGEYNLEWHDVSDTFAKRSLETSVGGYDLTETAGEFLNGLCATGHKVIDGSRYRVVSASYFNEFSSGVATAADHMADPYVLFRETQRFELDKVLATLKAY